MDYSCDNDYVKIIVPGIHDDEDDGNCDETQTAQYDRNIDHGSGTEAHHY